MKLKWSKLKEKTRSACGRTVNSMKRKKFLWGASASTAALLGLVIVANIRSCCIKPSAEEIKKRKQVEIRKKIERKLKKLDEKCSRNDVDAPYRGCLTVEERIAKKKKAVEYEKSGKINSAMDLYLELGMIKKVAELKNSPKCRAKCRKKSGEQVLIHNRVQSKYLSSGKPAEKKAVPAEPKGKPGPAEETAEKPSGSEKTPVKKKTRE